MSTRYTKSNKFTGVYYDTLKNKDKAYYITYRDNNKKKWLKIGLHSEGIREAFCNNKRNEIVTKLRLGEDLPIVAQRNIQTFTDVAKQFYDEKELYNKQNKKTRARVEKHVINTLGSIPINKVTKSQILSLRKSIIEKLSPASVNFIIGQISAIFNWAIENELIDKNPSANIKNLKVDNTRLRYLSLEEIKKLKDRIFNTKDLYYFVILGLSTGGRLQTLCNIKLKDILQNGSIRLYDFKNESEYFGYLDETLISELTNFVKHIDKTDDEYIFQSTAIQNYTNQYYYRKLQPIFDELFNLNDVDRQNKVTIHTLRHTFASQLAIAEVPILTIKKLMNHNDISTTMKYAKLSKNSGEIHSKRLTKTILSL